jgi:hypothetical protein
MASVNDTNAWRRCAMRAAAARGGLERGLRVAFQLDKDLPSPLAEALQRAETAIERARAMPPRPEDQQPANLPLGFRHA